MVTIWRCFICICLQYMILYNYKTIIIKLILNLYENLKLDITHIITNLADYEGEMKYNKYIHTKFINLLFNIQLYFKNYNTSTVLRKDDPMLKKLLIILIIITCIMPQNIYANSGKKNIIDFACSFDNIAVVYEDGTVWASGSNVSRQLGKGAEYKDLNPYSNSTSSPVLVQGLDDITNVALGNFFIAALKKDGTVWTVGNCNSESEDTPQMIQGLSDIKKIVANSGAIVMIKADGTVWTMDYADGQSKLYMVQGITQAVDISVSFNPNRTMYGSNIGGRAAAVDINGKVWVWEISEGVAKRVEGIDNVKNTEIELYRQYFLKKDGTVWFLGETINSVSGIPGINKATKPVQLRELKNIKDLQCGDFYTVALDTDGTLWSWGRNSDGCLGLGDVREASKPTKISNIKNITKISVGHYNSVAALNNNNELFAWGSNQYGSFGISRRKYVDKPTQILNDIKIKTVVSKSDYSNSYFIDVSGNVYVTGSTKYSGVGNVDDPEKYLIKPVLIQNLKSIIDLDASGNSAVALDKSGNIWGWGINDQCKLGIKSNVYHTGIVKIANVPDAYKVYAGDLFSIIYKKDGNILSMGLNRLLDVSKENWLKTIESKTIVPNSKYIREMLSYSEYQQECTLILKSDGTVWENGIGIRNIASQKTQFSKEQRQIKELKDIVDIDMKNGYCLALDKNGKVWSWNRANNVPRLIEGISDVVKINAGIGFYKVIKTDGSVWAWGDNEYGQIGQTVNQENAYIFIPTKIEGLENIVQVTGTNDSSIALDSNGKVFVFGNNGCGQLGLNEPFIFYSPIKTSF